MEGKLDALVNFVTQLAANQKPASDAKFSARNDAIVIRGVHDVATDTSAETRKLEGKLDSLVNLVTHLAANQKSASVARQFSARNDVIVIRGVHDVAIDTSTETRNLEGKLDALVNLVTQLAANQKPASVAKVYDICTSIDHHTSFSAKNDTIVIRGVHDVATDTSADTRKLEGKLDTLVYLVTQLSANQKPAFVARVCGISSSNDHYTSVCSPSQKSRVDEHPEAYAANTYSRPQQGVHDAATDTSAETRKLEAKLDSLVNLFNTRNDVIVIIGVHDVATDTSAETRKLEGKLDAIVNLVTQLATNQKLASVARIRGIRSSNHHYISVCSSLRQSGVDKHCEAYAANTYSRPQQQQREGT
ncbi:hypothetical protein Fmac_032822 [Flemingia macrophylla]|uniref:Uncharacterized protein n=1 Tax=Flemingia macrophylla TaxID=520843 RepID=A0ABD1L619_9FABA